MVENFEVGEYYLRHPEKGAESLLLCASTRDKEGTRCVKLVKIRLPYNTTASMEVDPCTFSPKTKSNYTCIPKSVVKSALEFHMEKGVIYVAQIDSTTGTIGSNRLLDILRSAPGLLSDGRIGFVTLKDLAVSRAEYDRFIGRLMRDAGESGCEDAAERRAISDTCKLMK